MTAPLPFDRGGNAASGTLIVLMHFFGSSRREWTQAAELLAGQWQTLCLDLPGFGDAAHVAGYAVAEMADAVEHTVAAVGAEKVVLVGHSMSGKVAAVLAARPLAKLAGLVLVAPSPPGPEPIAPAALDQMLRYGRDRASADAYLDANTARPLAGEVREQAIAAFVQANPAAWTAWLTHGSQEDWTDRVGRLACPTLLVTGSEDASLGLAVQKRHTLPSLEDVRTHEIAGVGHVVPLEAPGELAGAIAAFVAAL